MNEIWIVFGEWTLQEDRDEWMVVGYTNEEQALFHKDAANKWFDENKTNPRIRAHLNPLKNPYDPNMHIWWDQVTYLVKKCPLIVRHLDEFLEANGQ